ncbi:hypothetical protein V8F33_006842 [Rhypophila sp. PSN 637]
MKFPAVTALAFLDEMSQGRTIPRNRFLPESIRYFVPDDAEFREATEDALLKANFERLRSNLARPSRDIDLAFRKENPTPVSSVITSQDPAPTTVTTSDNTEEGAVDHTPPIVGKLGSECVTPGTRLALQMLLPHLQKGLLSSGPTSGDMRHNSIMLLLALDKVNTDMNLGMDLKYLWTTQLENHLHVLSFFWNCFVLDFKNSGVTLGVFDLQEVVMPAVDYFEHLYKSDIPRPPGRDRLQALVDKVLATVRRDGVEWVVRFGHLVEKVMEAGVPGEDDAKVLYHSGRHMSQIIVKEWEEEVDSGERQSESAQKQKPTNGDGKTWRTELDNEDEDYYGDSTRDVYWDHLEEDDFRCSSWRGSSPSSNKDFTACDQECGYCGQCDY